MPDQTPPQSVVHPAAHIPAGHASVTHQTAEGKILAQQHDQAILAAAQKAEAAHSGHTTPVVTVAEATKQITVPPTVPVKMVTPPATVPVKMAPPARPVVAKREPKSSTKGKLPPW